MCIGPQPSEDCLNFVSVMLLGDLGGSDRHNFDYSCHAEKADALGENAASTSFSMSWNGRGDWIRTNDPLLPKQVRYQTALRPEPCWVSCRFW